MGALSSRECEAEKNLVEPFDGLRFICCGIHPLSYLVAVSTNTKIHSKIVEAYYISR